MTDLILNDKYRDSAYYQIILFTVILGKQACHQSRSPYMASFMKSFAFAPDVKLILLSDDKSCKYPNLPNNIIFVNFTWRDLTERVDIELKTNISHLYQGQFHYKVCDFRPLIPFLYPELFREGNAYCETNRSCPVVRWMGWTDNDMWYSNDLFDFLIKLGKETTIQEWRPNEYIQTHSSWGPITVFEPKSYFQRIIPRLKANLSLLMPMLYNVSGSSYYDERGQPEWGGLGYKYSFSYILELANISYKIGAHIGALLSDLDCIVRKTVLNPQPIRDSSRKTDPACGYCRMSVIENKIELYDYQNRSLLFCHHQFSKKFHKNIFSNANAIRWKHHTHALKNNKSILSSMNQGIKIFS
mmetsp:Transcript_23506/g.23713  ORF Transcript_23506/g.23713 Transcript_23506/m.23713 type:complete len:357 (+) Transcript_23506:114-1184(+)